MDIISYIAAAYFVPAICLLVWYGFNKDPDAVKKAFSWPKTVYDKVK